MAIRLPIWVSVLLLLACSAVRAEVTVPRIEDLTVEAELARERGLPLLIMFYSRECPYCMRVEEDFLEPMLISGDYTDKVLIRRLEVNDRDTVVDFDGRRVDASEVSGRYRVRVTPTLVFVDSNGQELTERMIGLTTPDFYGGYLDEAILTSLKRLRDAPLRTAEQDR